MRFFSSKKQSNSICEICQDETRNSYQLCILEKPTDVLTIEKSQIFRGKYHVLTNLISPLDNIFAENTTISQLVASRIPSLLQKNNDLEVIIFFRAGFAAEATTAYIKDLLQEKGLLKNLKITKLAQGLPLYYNPDTLDQATMIQALEDRREI
ncbi:toprim domain-containing protein [Candidatus Gracilibacteria bacterium]|nr:toprim domain-containing protein [Candidatus Gracilibacteria bacterium]